MLLLLVFLVLDSFCGALIGWCCCLDLSLRMQMFSTKFISRDLHHLGSPSAPLTAVRKRSQTGGRQIKAVAPTLHPDLSWISSAQYLRPARWATSDGKLSPSLVFSPLSLCLFCGAQVHSAHQWRRANANVLCLNTVLISFSTVCVSLWF